MNKDSRNLRSAVPDWDGLREVERAHALRIARHVSRRREIETELAAVMAALAVEIQDAQHAGVQVSRIASWLPNPLKDWRLGVTRNAVYKLMERHLPAERRSL